MWRPRVVIPAGRLEGKAFSAFTEAEARRHRFRTSLRIDGNSDDSV
jgi:hypothetical protein